MSWTTYQKTYRWVKQVDKTHSRQWSEWNKTRLRIKNLWLYRIILIKFHTISNNQAMWWSHNTRVVFEDEADSYSKSCLVNKLVKQLVQNPIEISQQNLLHAQELEKQVYDEEVKLKNHALCEKLCPNSKFIKIKWNKKLEAKFLAFSEFYIWWKSRLTN